MQNVKIEPFKVIGIGLRTINANEQAAKDITALWQRFMGENLLDAIPNKLDNKVYSLYTAYEGDHTQAYTAMLGCKVTSLDIIPDGMIGKSIEGGNYLRITAKGDLSKGLIVNQWAKIWEMDLERLYTADFELFGPEAQDPANARVDFYVSVK